jgi:hypothetical protein
MYDKEWYLDIKGAEVSIGDEVTDFRGDRWEFRGITRHPELGKSGKILTENPLTRAEYEFYPNVVGGEILPREPAELTPFTPEAREYADENWEAGQHGRAFECQGCHAILHTDAQVADHKDRHGLVIQLTPDFEVTVEPELRRTSVSLYDLENALAKLDIYLPGHSYAETATAIMNAEG